MFSFEYFLVEYFPLNISGNWSYSNDTVDQGVFLPIPTYTHTFKSQVLIFAELYRPPFGSPSSNTRPVRT